MSVYTAGSETKPVAYESRAESRLRVVGKEFESGFGLAFPKLYDLGSSDDSANAAAHAIASGFTGVIGTATAMQAVSIGHCFVRVTLGAEDICYSKVTRSVRLDVEDERLGCGLPHRPDGLIVSFEASIDLLSYRKHSIAKGLADITERARRHWSGVIVGLQGIDELLERFGGPFDVLLCNLADDDLPSISTEAQYLQLVAPCKPILFSVDVAARQLPIAQLNWEFRQLCFEGVAGLVFERHIFHPDDKLVLDNLPFSEAFPWPMISIVVPCRNEAPYIDRCLRALLALDYPRVEIIVVDNGSTDGTLDRARGYPVKAIQSEVGLCKARNAGFREATGEIVAYVDADAFPARKWLRFIAIRMMTSGSVAVGGALLVPPTLRLRSRLIGCMPGNPEAVRKGLNDCAHAAGCNIAVYREILEAIGGFDETFGAGDDVDLCWTLIEHGWPIGFHQSAVVWHYPRASLRAFLRQQYSYGRGEVRLERKWPTKFSGTGDIEWPTGVYSNIRKEGFENVQRNERIRARDRRARRLMFPYDGRALALIALDARATLLILTLLSCALLANGTAIRAWCGVGALLIAVLVVVASARVARSELLRRGETATWCRAILMVPGVLCQPLARRLGRLREKAAICRRAVAWLSERHSAGTPARVVRRDGRQGLVGILRSASEHLLSLRPRLENEDWELSASVLRFCSVRLSSLSVRDCGGGSNGRTRRRVLITSREMVGGLGRAVVAVAFVGSLFAWLGEPWVATLFGTAALVMLLLTGLDLTLTMAVIRVALDDADRALDAERDLPRR